MKTTKRTNYPLPFKILGYVCNIVCQTTIEKKLLKKTNIQSKCFLQVGCQTYSEETVKSIQSILSYGLKIENNKFNLDTVNEILSIMNKLKLKP